MRLSIPMLGLLVAGMAMISLTACETNQPGTNNTMGAYSAMIDGRPDKVAAAAKSSVQDMKLNNVNANWTKVDGKVTALTAQGQDVNIDIVQAGDNVSKVTVRVGAGDESLSEDIINRIKKNM